MIYYTRVVCAIVIFGSFLLLAPWFAAEHREDAIKKYEYDTPVPESWKAVVMEHGELKEWSLGTVSDNPLGFGACALVFLSAIAFFVADVFIKMKLPPPSKPEAGVP